MIRGYIKQNGGEVKRIEERMLRSVNGCMARAGLSEKEVESTTGLPRLNQRLEQLELPPDFYIAFQRMGSHAVHGTWTNLMHFYLRDPKSGPMTLKDDPTPPREDQYAAHAMLVLQAAGALAQFAFEEDERKDAEATYERLLAEVWRVYEELLGPDSEVVSRET